MKLRRLTGRSDWAAIEHIYDALLNAYLERSSDRPGSRRALARDAAPGA